jgi:hypothetical protein
MQSPRLENWDIAKRSISNVHLEELAEHGLLAVQSPIKTPKK